MLCVSFSMDETTMRSKGHHADIKRMTYKSKVNGLQIYDLCQKGYIYQIFMCDDPSSKTYLAKRMLLFHSRVIEIFDTAEGKHHQCVMDDLYN